ncbi:MAG: hypothetical protein KDD55_07510 [Bdellovibrionales bacterium]|nr:hypothetical protein [Bdellovibrionales bacterium]
MNLLIVSPHFPPINAPDHQRVRMALPFLLELGWKITLLCVHEDDVEGIQEPDLLKTIPSEVRIEKVRAIPVSIAKCLGMRTLGWRSYFALKQRGQNLLKESSFDLIYFSSTTFFSFLLGPIWKQKFRVPYIVDYQDPWLNTYYRDHQVSPPGGWLKYSLSQLVARAGEPRVVRELSALTSVSSQYIKTLLARYPDLHEDQCYLLPFGAAENDFTFIESLPKERALMFDPHYEINNTPHRRNFVYAGRIGPDMHTSLNAFFGALKTIFEQAPHLQDEIHLWFLGTTYAPADKASPQVLPIAAKYDLESFITEIPTRIPYFSALQSLRLAHGTLMFGSDDEAYSPSKVYPSILAGRPLFALFPSSGEVAPFVRETTEARVVVLDELDESHKEVDIISGQLASFLEAPLEEELYVDKARFSKHTAKEMSQVLHRIFSSHTLKKS